MYLNRLEFDLHLKASSQISIYSGEAEITGEGEVNIRLLTRNHEGELIIPASSFKGAWRQCFGGDGSEIFGHAEHGRQSVGIMGRLQLGDAVAQGAVKAQKRERTSIDRDKGSAERNKLFGDLCAPAGTKFALKGLLFYAGEQTVEDAVQELSQLLRPIYEAGIQLGSGTKFGQGHLSISAPPTVKYYAFDAAKGDFPAKGTHYEGRIESVSNKRQTSLVDLNIELKSDTPFLIIAKTQKSADGANIMPLMEGDGPALPLTSIYGALRSKFAWLESCRALANGTDAAPVDDRMLDHKLNGGVTDALSQAKVLTPIERLFGVSGFKGLLECQSLERIHAGQKITLQNVAIDRFTGGSLDGALFSTEAYMHTAWSLKLTIPAERAAKLYKHLGEETLQQDLDVLKRLANDLQNDPLFLGHGAAKGLGWFEVNATLEDSSTKGVLQ